MTHSELLRLYTNFQSLYKSLSLNPKCSIIGIYKDDNNIYSFLCKIMDGNSFHNSISFGAFSRRDLEKVFNYITLASDVYMSETNQKLYLLLNDILKPYKYA